MSWRSSGCPTTLPTTSITPTLRRKVPCAATCSIAGAPRRPAGRPAAPLAQQPVPPGQGQAFVAAQVHFPLAWQTQYPVFIALDVWRDMPPTLQTTQVATVQAWPACGVVVGQVASSGAGIL